LPPQAPKIRALIVDDEPLARSNLRILLQNDPEIELVGECASGVEAVSEIPRQRPDLLFLDIQMPECDGFDVLEMLGTAAPLVIVFVTAFDEYGIRAFEAGAQDYILKPFDNVRFERALARAKQRVSQMNGGLHSPERLAIKNRGEICFVKISEIDWIEAADYYACLHVAGKSHLLRRSLSDLEKHLDPELFCRIHRSTIVNLDRVSAIQIGEDGECEVLLKNGVRLRLSKRYRKHMQSLVEKLHGPQQQYSFD